MPQPCCRNAASMQYIYQELRTRIGTPATASSSSGPEPGPGHTEAKKGDATHSRASTKGQPSGDGPNRQHRARAPTASEEAADAVEVISGKPAAERQRPREPPSGSHARAIAESAPATARNPRTPEDPHETAQAPGTNTARADTPAPTKTTQNPQKGPRTKRRGPPNRRSGRPPPNAPRQAPLGRRPQQSPGGKWGNQRRAGAPQRRGNSSPRPPAVSPTNHKHRTNAGRTPLKKTHTHTHTHTQGPQPPAHTAQRAPAQRAHARRADWGP